MTTADDYQDLVPQDIGTEPEEQSNPADQDIYDEFVAFADPEQLAEAARRAGVEVLNAYRKAIGKVAFEVARVQRVEALMKVETPPGEEKYSAPTLRYRKIFAGIQERARQRIAAFEPTEWEPIYIGPIEKELKGTNGAQRRQWILKHKKEYLMPGVWRISTRTIHRDDPKYAPMRIFVRNECIAKYMADAPNDDPTSILVLDEPRGYRADRYQ